MRRFLCLLVAAFAFLLAQSPVRADDLVLDRFGDYLEALRAQSGIPGLSAAIVGNTDITWERAFGKIDLEKSVATRSDTPFQLDGITQVFTASLVLRCVEWGWLRLDDRLGNFSANSAEPNATIRQVLAHIADDGTFRYRPDRIALLTPPLGACSGDFRGQLASLLDQLAMTDSVPGSDVVQLAPSPAGIFTTATLDRYRSVLSRLAVPYAVDASGHATLSRYSTMTITPATGLIATERDIAQFILALRKGAIMRPETLALAWRPATNAAGQALPHGLGWFVQSYNGEPVVWQFGLSQGASSSLIVTVPGRGLTLVLLANSDGLSAPFPLAAGDLNSSPFGRLFLGLFVR
jgi:CubicO group peptidase (beta-lactamase class C family)